MSPAKRNPRKRPRGEGAVFQRCDLARGCPPREPVEQPDGTVKLVRPEHKCRGLWIARLELEDGSRPQRGARTRNLALSRLDSMKREVAESGGVTKSITNDEWFRYWIDCVWSGRPNTKSTYESIYRVHVGPAIGSRQVRKITANPAPLRSLLTTGRLADLGSTRRQAYIMLNELYEAARQEGYATRNPMELIRKPTPKKGSRDALTTAQMRELLSHNARTGDRLASRWMAVPYTLQRSGECRGLVWDRVDWDNDKLDVSWQLQDLPYKHGCGERLTNEVWPCEKGRAGSCPRREFDVPLDYEYHQLYGALSLVVPKSEKGERIIPLLPTMRLGLEQRWRQYQDERANYVVDYGLVWCRPDGNPLRANDDGAGWKALERAAGVPAHDLHGGRHTGATLLLEAGVPDPVVQALMGHATAATSHGYQHADVTLLRRYMIDAIETPLAIE